MSSRPVIYLIDGTAAGRSDVYAWRFGGSDLHRVTHDIQPDSQLGVSSISGTPGGVVFEDGGGVSGAPSVGTIDDSKVNRTTIAGVSRLYTPTLSNTGELAFSSLRRADSVHHPIGTIVVRRSLMSGKLRTIVRRPDHLIAEPTWNPAGTELAYLLYSADDYRSRHIVIVNDRGQHINTIADASLEAGALAWSPTTYWLGTVGKGGSAFVSARTGAVHALPHGWKFGCWQAGGDSALVINGKEVGLSSPAHPGTISRKTSLPGTNDAFGCAYQPRDAS